MKVQRSFYQRSALDTAPELLGKIFVRHIGRRRLAAVITEVEAYLGQDDPASHAFRGRTERNAVMFGEGGCLYVYFTYGMHYCANIVTGPAHRAEAVLIRGVVPVDGEDVMLAHRTRNGRQPAPAHLTDGPAKFCQAFGITRSENGADLSGDEIYLLDAPIVPPRSILRSERIGISIGKEHRWRFFIRPDSLLAPDRVLL